MPIVDLYENSDQRHNLAHFATLASLAAVDGVISEKEKAILDKLAFRLNITDEEYRIDGIGFRALAYDVFVFGEPASYGVSMGMNF